MKILKNFLLLAGAEVVSKCVTFAAFAYLARVLRPDNYGVVEFAGAILMCGSLIVDQGFSAFGARRIATDPLRTASLTVEIVTARFALAAISYLGLFLFALWLNQGPVVFRLLLIYGLSLWLLPLLLQWVFQGHDQMHLIAVAQVIRQTIFAVVVFLFVRGPKQIEFVGWAEVAAVGCASAFCIVAYLRRFQLPSSLRPTVSRALFREGVPIGLSQMFWVIKMFGGTLILGLIATSQEVAFFGGAQRILVAMHAFVWLYFYNLFPSLSRTWQTDNFEFNRMLASSLQSCIWIAVAGCIAWAILSNRLIQFVYGSAFRPAGSVLAVLSVVWGLALIHGHYRFALIAAKRADKEMIASAIGACVAVISIPVGYSYFGISGAAAGLVLADVVTLIVVNAFARKLLFVESNTRLLGTLRT